MSYSIEEITPVAYENCFFTIRNKQGYCFDSNQSFIEQSNDWHYLIKGDSHTPVLGKDYITIDEAVVRLVTSFHTGVHAYSGVYSILLNYFSKAENSKYKFVVFKELQSGILEVVEKLVGKSRIIYLESDALYGFREVLLIPNSLHSFLENEKITRDISNFIQSKIIDADYKTNYIKTAIIKKLESSVSSTMGIVDYKVANSFCKRNGYISVEPSDVGEIGLANILHNSEEVVFSWGTTFMKNFIYLSDKCKKVTVIIFGQDFYNEYQNAKERDILVTSFRNAKFTYYIEPDLEKLQFIN
jgi:hypothetical protein